MVHGSISPSRCPCPGRKFIWSHYLLTFISCPSHPLQSRNRPSLLSPRTLYSTMDMDMPPTASSTPMMSSMMKPWLHLTGGDFLYFDSLAPRSGGAIAAAAIVLFLLAVFDRWMHAMRGVMEARWRARSVQLERNLPHLASNSSIERGP